MCTDPQCPGPSALLVENAEAPESIKADLGNPKLAAERDIPIEYNLIVMQHKYRSNDKNFPQIT